jgi:hypothetical protein
MFRLLWESPSEEYMFLWNAAVATHTMKQLPQATIEKVHEHYDKMIALNRVDPLQDIGIARPDPFWLSVTLADLGVLPILGNKKAKWYYVRNHRSARGNIAPQGEALWSQVCKDILTEYGVDAQDEQ